MNKPFEANERVEVDGIRGPCHFEGYGPLEDDCSILVKEDGALPVRHLVKIEKVKKCGPLPSSSSSN